MTQEPRKSVAAPLPDDDVTNTPPPFAPDHSIIEQRATLSPVYDVMLVLSVLALLVMWVVR